MLWGFAVYEVFERMAYYGISSNLIIYMTEKLHQGTITSANNVTNRVGVIWMTPILGAYVADAHLGSYCTLLIGSSLYLVVLLLLLPPPFYILLYFFFKFICLILSLDLRTVKSKTYVSRLGYVWSPNQRL